MNEKNEDKVKNLLLINMSTLPSPKNLRENYYKKAEKLQKSDGGQSETIQYSFCGVSQLESGTKYFLRKLQLEGKKLDRIIIVESPETRHELREISELESYLQKDEDYRFLNCEEDSSKTNAVRFYKERICQYIQGREEVKGDPDNPKFREQICNYEKGVGSLFSSNEELNNLFDDIEIDERNPLSDEKDLLLEEQKVLFKGVQDLCQKIQEFAEVEEDSTVKLYLYMQGGKRHEAFIINAAVNMLKMRDIEVAASVAVEFSEKKDFNNIVDSTLDDRIFEMVSGMNEFISTGRGDTLLSFCDNAEGLVYLAPERDMIDAIRRISTAISICNVYSFNSAINAFNKELKKYERIYSTNLLFKTFVKDLKDDYDKFHLLEETQSPTIQQVLWCLDKKLYQQALTLLEAHVPDDIVENKMIYYGNNEKLKNLLDMLVSEKKLLQSDDWCLEKGGKVQPKYVNYVWIHKELQVKHKKHYILSLKLPTGWEFNTDATSQEDNDRIVSLLRKYSDICKIRNSINHSDNSVWLHGDQKLITAELIQDYINLFIECYNQMLEDSIQVDLSQQILESEPVSKEA